MATVELVLALLAAVTLGGAIVKWTPFPLPILLVVVGAAMSFVSGFDAIRIDPQLFLLLFIPPILFADAYALPRRDFVRVLKPVLLLALGLVVLTVVAVGYLLHWMIPELPLAVAFTGMSSRGMRFGFAAEKPRFPKATEGARAIGSNRSPVHGGPSS